MWLIVTIFPPRYITRFTEESFSVLISLIFIAEAFKKASGITKYYPLHTGVIRKYSKLSEAYAPFIPSTSQQELRRMCPNE